MEVKDKVIKFHDLGIECKIKSKRLDIPVSTVGSIMREWKVHHITHTLARQCPPLKVSTKTR